MASDFPIKNKKARESLAVAGHLIGCYLAARGGLKELGILRSERSLEGDYAEWLVAKLLGLELSKTSIEKGVDARDANGKTYQIKSRKVRSISQNTSFDLRDIRSRFDYLIPVFFSPSLEVLAILRVPYDVVTELGSQTSSTFRFRWNRKCARHPRVERLFYRETEEV